MTELNASGPAEPMSDEPCWKLVYPNGREVEGSGGERHFATKNRAEEQIAEYTNHWGVPAPVQVEGLCFEVECPHCMTSFDEDGDGMIVHFTSRKDALRDVVQFGWVVKDGTAWCSKDCIDDYEELSGAEVPEVAS